MNNWTDHALTENSGTIALTAGQRYDIRMEFYENGGLATARLLWSSPSTPKAVVPRRASIRRRRCAAAIFVNFQPSTSPVPAGYLADGGLVYGNRGNGQTYGWTIDNTAQTRDRNASNSPDQRYDTLTHLQKPANPDAVWEIAVPNGTYRVRIVSGDALELRQRVPDHGRGCAHRERHADDVDTVDRGDLHGDGHRRPADDSQRRGREQQQDLLRRDHSALR